MYDVDVIIPAFNEETLIGNALSSVLAQTLPARRIIVVDDGSGDRTVDRVQAMAADHDGVPVEIVRNDHAGVSAARNAGIMASRASHVALLDADDAWTPNKLELQMALWARGDDGLGVVYCDTLAMTADGTTKPRRMSKTLLRGDLAGPMLDRCLIRGSCSAVVIRRSLFETAGLFDETLSSGEDWDMWIRLSRICTFDFVDQALVHQRQPRGDAAAHRRHRIEGEFQLLEKLARQGDLTGAAVQSMARRMAELNMSLTNLAYYPDMSDDVKRAFRSIPAMAGRALGWTNRVLGK